jgi:hypothetical protein
MERSATSPSSDAIELRLARLERDHRRLRWVVGAALFGATCALIAGVRRPPVDTIEAARFVIRDELGRERALFGFDHPSSPRHSPLRLGLYNPDDGSSLIVWLSGAFAGVTASTRGTDGTPLRAETFANPQEGSGFRLSGAGRRAPAALRARNGAGQLVLEDKTGRVTFQAPQ